MNTHYTVEQAAELLAMHPKTIQRYIREGKLRAAKIGKGWRIAGRDLSVFLEQRVSPGSEKAEAAAPVKQAAVSSVVDLFGMEAEETSRLSGLVLAALNGKPDEYGQSTMHIQQLGADGTVRITLWGTLPFVQEMLAFISSVLEQADGYPLIH